MSVRGLICFMPKTEEGDIDALISLNEGELHDLKSDGCGMESVCRMDCLGIWSINISYINPPPNIPLDTTTRRIKKMDWTGTKPGI